MTSEISRVAPWPWIERILALKCDKCGRADLLDVEDKTGITEFYELHSHRELESTIMEDAFEIIADPEDFQDLDDHNIIDQINAILKEVGDKDN